MAILSGFHYETSPRYATDHLNMVPLDTLGDALYEERAASAVIPGSHGSLVRVDSGAVAPRVLSGSISRNYSDDFYHRIHITPITVELGNVVGSQVHEVEVWNAHIHTHKNLTTITANNSEGILLDEPIAAPTEFGNLEARTYTLRVDIVGPPTIDASFEFDFGDETPALKVTGTRVVVWPFMAQVSHREGLEWKTDIIRTYEAEQRSALRNAPRQSFQYQWQLTPPQYSQARAISEAWAHRIYGVPVWAEGKEAGPVAEGADQILIDTSSADFREGGLAVVWDGSDLNEAVEVEAVLADRLVLKRPTIKSYPSAYVAPLRLGRALGGIRYTHSAFDEVRASGEFAITDNVELTDESSFPQYRGADVYTGRNYLLSDLSERVSRAVDVFDNGSGPVEVLPQRGWLDKKSSISFVCQGLDELWQLRGWLHGKRGKQKSFWMPSWLPDLVVAENYAGGTELVVEDSGFSSLVGSADVMVRKVDGSMEFVRILNGGVNAEGLDLLNLDGTLSGPLTVAEIDRVSILRRIRFDADTININRDGAREARITVATVEVPDEL